MNNGNQKGHFLDLRGLAPSTSMAKNADSYLVLAYISIYGITDIPLLAQKSWYELPATASSSGSKSKKVRSLVIDFITIPEFDLELLEKIEEFYML